MGPYLMKANDHPPNTSTLFSIQRGLAKHQLQISVQSIEIPSNKSAFISHIFIIAWQNFHTTTPENVDNFNLLKSTQYANLIKYSVSIMFPV